MRPMLLAGYAKHYGSTTLHKVWVARNLARVGVELARRAVMHDLSKYAKVEAEGFAEVIFDLKTTTYGTEEYRALLRRIRPSLDHHYARNTHHPEHWRGGFADMGLLDRIEMLCDWEAASRRHADGNLARSIRQNQERFDYSDADARALEDLAIKLNLM